MHGPDMRVLVRVSVLAGIVLALGAAGGWLAAELETLSRPPVEAPGAVWIGLAILYVVVLALPFVPGIELGLGIMLLLGARGVLLVYLCTQVALALGFVIGRLVPVSSLAKAIRLLKLERAQSMSDQLEAQRADLLILDLARRAPSHWVGRALAHRYLALAAALNLPGNVALGGAGGVALLAGASGLFSLPRYCLLMAVATSPVPLLLLLQRAMSTGSGWFE